MSAILLLAKQFRETNLLVTKNGLIINNKTGKPAKVFTTYHGYLRVFTTINGERKGFYLHRIVAEVFAPTQDALKNVINHIDNNPLNCKLENLEWCTQAHNIQHAAKQGRMSHGTHRHTSKLNDEKIKMIRELICFQGQTKSRIARTFGVSLTIISRIAQGQAWTHVN